MPSSLAQHLADWASWTVFAALAFGLPTLGYVFLCLDVRAYLRSLRRALVPLWPLRRDAPAWAQRYTPRSVAAFGLALPCGEEELLAAYRAKVKEIHPDRGGDERLFRLWQARFEEARRALRDEDACDADSHGRERRRHAAAVRVWQSPPGVDGQV